MSASQPRQDAQSIVFSSKGPIEGMKQSLANRFMHSTIVLCYSLIDVMAWLSLPPEKTAVHRGDFIKWSEQYVIPNGSFNCTAEDLYSARCSVLHTMTAESELTREGRAVKIAYTWGNIPPLSPAQLQEGNIIGTMLHLDSLCSAIERGSKQFFANILTDNKQLDTVNSRARKLFVQFETSVSKTH